MNSTEVIINTPIELPCDYFKDKEGIKKVIIESDFDLDDDCAPHFSWLKELEEFEVRCDCNYFVEDGVLYFNSIISPFTTKNFMDDFTGVVEGKILLAFPPGRKMKEFVVPSDVVAIASGAFAGSKLEKIVIPDSVEHIGFVVFLDMQHLKYLHVPNRIIDLRIDHYEDENINFELFPNKEGMKLDDDVVRLWNYVRDCEPLYEFRPEYRILTDEDNMPSF